MSREGPRAPASEPELPEPYESLVRWQFGAQPGSPTAEEARARLLVLLARDVSRALTAFNATTTRLNQVLIGLTVVLVLLGGVQLVLTFYRPPAGHGGPLPEQPQATQPVAGAVERRMLIAQGDNLLQELKTLAWAYRQERGTWAGITTENLADTLRFSPPPDGCWSFWVNSVQEGAPGELASIEFIARSAPRRSGCGALVNFGSIALVLRSDGTSSLRQIR